MQASNELGDLPDHEVCMPSGPVSPDPLPVAAPGAERPAAEPHRLPTDETFISSPSEG